ncbi:MAG TPA: hypothetical protein VMS01_10935 [Stellaceae bacterium]|nr:hypothetical protein [Stellaceae bacterium]
MRSWVLLAAFGAATAPLVILTGCVPAVMTPTVVATPGPGKLPADLASDHTACAVQANQQMAPAVQAANNQVTGTALQNVFTGTGDNAVAVNTQATSALQQQYDTAYSACMYARGDNVPPYYMQPTYYAEPAEPTSSHHGKRRVAHKAASPTPTTTAASNSGPAAGSGFVVPAPTPASGSGFVQPAPVQPASANSGFAVPPPATH